jgi:hypothetical protein
VKAAFTILILLTCASSSFAQVAIPASGLSVAIQAKVVATTLVLDEPDSYCTASPVTPDGYMITALHCVRTCLTANSAGETGNNLYVGLQDLFVSTRSQATNVLCKDLSFPALGVRGVTVVATGPAISQFDATFLSAFGSLYLELKAHGFASRSNDYAILKINTPRALTCLPLSAVTVPAETAIWALGYPVPADPSKQKPILSASAGRIYSSALESRAYAAATALIDKSYIQSVYSEEGVLYSSASTQFGQSGGPVISADGTLVGVVSGFTTVTLKDNSEVHELVASTSSSILKSLPPALAATLIQKSAGCR